MPVCEIVSKSSETYAINVEALHEEIAAFYADIHADGVEFARRKEVVERLKKFLESQPQNRRVKIEPFGSYLTGTFLRSSDIDFVAVVRCRSATRPFHPSTWLGTFRAQMAKHIDTDDVENCSFIPLQYLPKASVPLIKTLDFQSRLKLDVSCVASDSVTTHDGLKTSQWIVEKNKEFPGLPELVVILKETLWLRKLSNIHSGGISSHVLTLMAISLLQLNDTGSENLGDLLLQFLKLYGKDFDYENQAIVVTDGGKVISKDEMRKRLREEPSGLLSIQDPLDPAVDTAKSCQRGVIAAKMVFARVYDRLNERLNSAPAGKTERFLDALF